MASTYSRPEDYWAWYIQGDRIALVTTKDTSTKNSYESPDENITDGLLIEYSRQPIEVAKLSDIPDVDDMMHSAIVDYVKWKLWNDKPVQQGAPEASKYMSLWRIAVKMYSTRDKIGGTRAIVPSNFR